MMWISHSEPWWSSRKPEYASVKRAEIDPNQSLQLTAGNCGFNNVRWVATGFGLSDAFRQTPAATELWSLGGYGM